MDVLGIVDKIVSFALMIKEAVKTVQQNKRECSDIEQYVAQVSMILSRTKEKMEAFQHPSVRGALENLAKSIEEALALVTDCQRRQGVSRLWEAQEMAEELRRVRQDIRRNLELCSLATNVEHTIKLNNMQPASAPSPQMTLGDVATNASNSVRMSNIQQPGAPPLPVVRGIKQFTLSKLKAATNNFSDANVIDRGISIIYKGELDGLVVAIKKHGSIGYYIAHEVDIQDKINIVSELNHENLVRPLGYCQVHLDGEQVGAPELAFYFVEKYMPNGSMDNIIKRSPIRWSSCFRIIQGIAQGVHYLHEKHIVHLNLKPSIILLDSNKNPKIGDSLLYTRLDHGNAEIPSRTRMGGSMGYIAPEYEDIVSTKCDVYAFGVILLKLISNICRSKFKPRGVQDLTGWAWSAWKDGRMEKLLDRSLYDESELMEIKRCTVVGLLCVQRDRKDRPTMADVLAMLNGEKELLTPNKPA